MVVVPAKTVTDDDRLHRLAFFAIQPIAYAASARAWAALAAH
jgi:hypothetical protein